MSKFSPIAERLLARAANATDHNVGRLLYGFQKENVDTHYIVYLLNLCILNMCIAVVVSHVFFSTRSLRIEYDSFA